MRKNLPKTATAQRIENRAGTGLSDIVLTWEGLDYWIELKALPKHAEPMHFSYTCDWLCKEDFATLQTVNLNSLKLRPSQKAFAAKRISSGGVCFVLASARGTREKALCLLILTEDRGLAALRLCISDDWGQVFAALRSCGLAALRRTLQICKT